jgi:AraC family transcriptional regulator, transcriptional activator for feuABC-ybbA operon
MKMIIVIDYSWLLIYYCLINFVNSFSNKRKVFLISGLYSLPFDSFQLSFLKLHKGMAEHVNESNQFNTLIYIASGEGQMWREGKQFPVTEGKSYWISDSMLLTSVSTNLLFVYKLSCGKGVEELSTILSVPLADQQPQRAVPLWEEAEKLQRGKSISERCRFQAAVWNLLSALTDQAEVNRIEEAMEMILSHLSHPYSIAELAAKANMSPTSFSRAFRKRAGMSPKEFLNEERMKAAKELMLQKKGITAKEVALRVGLQDEFYFSRLFKRKEGIPPSVYMKRSKERIAVVSQLFLQDHLLSLGVQPVCAPSYPSVYPTSRGMPGYLEKDLEGTVLLNAEKTFVPAEILQTQPDRIIKTPLHNGQIQSVLLSHQQKVHHIPLNIEWNQYLREIASMLGQECKAECIEKEIHCLESKVKEELCPMTKKGRWAVIWIRRDEIRLYGRCNHALLDLLYQKLGFEPHPDLPNEGYRSVTVEEIAALNPDKLLILWSHETDVWRVAHTAEWKRIKAVETGEVYYPNSHDWDPWGPLGRKNMLFNFTATLKNSKLMNE